MKDKKILKWLEAHRDNPAEPGPLADRFYEYVTLRLEEKVKKSRWAQKAPELPLPGPPWDIIPSWINWIVRDQNDIYWGFSHKPILKTDDDGHTYWCSSFGRADEYMRGGPPLVHKDWRKSRAPRPITTPAQTEQFVISPRAYDHLGNSGENPPPSTPRPSAPPPQFPEELKDPWEGIDPKYQFMARDSDHTLYAYVLEPILITPGRYYRRMDDDSTIPLLIEEDCLGPIIRRPK